MAQIKLYRSTTPPSSIAEGGIWFNPNNKTIRLKTADGYDVFGEGLRDAVLTNGILTITKSDNSSITLDLNSIIPNRIDCGVY